MNREIIQPGGAGVYPLTGDVASQAGNAPVQVTGLQGVSISTPTLYGGEVLEFNGNTNNWVPTRRGAIFVNGLPVSDDYLISVNVPGMVEVSGTVVP